MHREWRKTWSAFAQELVKRLYSPCPSASLVILRHVGRFLRRFEKMSGYELDVKSDGGS